MGSFGGLAALVTRVIASNGVPAGHVGVATDQPNEGEKQ